MIRTAIATASLLFAASGAGATILYSNNFNRENGGVTALNYTSFNGLDVFSGSVDLLASGDLGVTCAGGRGACVDLSGTPGQRGRLISSKRFDVVPNRLYTLSFDVSGNQRPGSGELFDEFFAQFLFSPASNFNFFLLGGGFGNAEIDPVFPLIIGFARTAWVDQLTPFTTFTIGFSMKNPGQVSFNIGTFTDNGFGPILDNVRFAIVPEPATWAMLIAGFGLAGTALRRARAMAA